MIRKPKEIGREELSYETYRRVPYLKDTVYEIVSAFIDVLHDYMLDKRLIRLYKIGAFVPRIRKMRRKLGWDESKVYEIDRLWYYFKESSALTEELAKVHERDRKQDEYRARRTAGKAQEVSAGGGERE